MTTRKRVAARRPRAPSRKTKARRKRRLGAALNPARFLPTHQRYTAELLANVRRRFEDTPEPIPSLAADLGVAPGSVHRIARRYDWIRRVPAPPRGVLPAMRILQEAAALDASGVRADVAAAAADAAEIAADGDAAMPCTPSALKR